MNKPDDLKVFIASRETKCQECGEELDCHAWIVLAGESGMYPQCPAGREQVIAEHACRKYSGRVGRSAAAKDLAEDAVRLAVVAHVRHAETGYDALLLSGADRTEARARIRADIASIMNKWEVRK